MGDDKTKMDIDAQVVGSIADINITIVAPGSEIAQHIVAVALAIAADYGKVADDVATIRESVERAVA